MSVFDNGRISSEYSIPLVKSNSWVVKSALNGTDNWNNLPQNILPCNTVVVDDIDHTMITVTRSDSNGVFTETYDLPKPIRDFKTTLTYQNNDPALNGTHKFAFTNVLNDVPDHLTILLKNSTVVDGDPVDLPTYFHYSSSPNTIPLQYDPDQAPISAFVLGLVESSRDPANEIFDFHLSPVPPPLDIQLTCFNHVDLHWKKSRGGGQNIFAEVSLFDNSTDTVIRTEDFSAKMGNREHNFSLILNTEETALIEDWEQLFVRITLDGLVPDDPPNQRALQIFEVFFFVHESEWSC